MYFLFTWICTQFNNFFFSDSAFMPKTKLELISLLVCCCFRFCVAFLGLSVIKFESSSSPLHVHTLYENFYRTKAIRDGKHVTCYVVSKSEKRVQANTAEEDFCWNRKQAAFGFLRFAKHTKLSRCEIVITSKRFAALINDKMHTTYAQSCNNFDGFEHKRVSPQSR